MISSLHKVSFSRPSVVTAHEFSIPTGPIPGKTILGSKAKTIPGSNSCFIRGANTEAGGKVTDWIENKLNPRQGNQVIGTNGNIHQELLRIL